MAQADHKPRIGFVSQRLGALRKVLISPEKKELVRFGKMTEADGRNRGHRRARCRVGFVPLKRHALCKALISPEKKELVRFPKTTGADGRDHAALR